MTKKYLIITIVSVIMLVTASAMMLLKKNKSAADSNLLPVALHSFKIKDGGWGYEVLVNNKIYIHQDCIPAINSYKKFNTESDALLIGNRVLDKIKHGHKPFMTVQEINDSHIQY